MRSIDFNKTFLISLITFLMMTATFASAQQLTAKVDRNKISINESLTLTIRYTGNSNASPDLKGLDNDFEVVSQNQSSQFRSINGRTESFTDWIVSLIPRKEGTLTIPSFAIGHARSNPLTVTVTPETAAPAGTLREVFIETILDKPESYVQEQVRITYRLYFSVNISSLDPEPLALEDVLIEELPDVRYRRRVDDQFYNVVEFSYALYPQTSGQLEIPQLRWAAKLNRTGSRNYYMGGRYETKYLRTAEKTLTVKAQPDEFPSNATWLPSSKVTLTENWSKSPEYIEAGEPLTRVITLTAEGLNSSQLPAVAENLSTDSLKFYPEQPAKNDDKSSYGVTGRREEKFAVVASASGELIIPAIKVPWWDVTSNELKYAEIPERKVIVAKGKTATEPDVLDAKPPVLSDELIAPGEPVDNEDATYWRALAIVSTAAAILFLILWLYTRNRILQTNASNAEKQAKQKRQKELKESEAFSLIKTAAEANNATALRTAILNWSAIRGYSASSLYELGLATGDSALQNELGNLDSSVYGKNAEACNITSLINSLSALRNKAASKLQTQDKTLPELYKA